MRIQIILVSALLSCLLCKAQTVSTIFDGQFHDGLEIDELGNIYGSDFSGDSVYRYEVATGEVTVFKSGFTSPNGIGRSSNDEIYICDHFANKIFKYDTEANELGVFEGFNRPAGVKNIPGTADMLVVEYNGNSIKKIAEDGAITTLFSGGLLNGPAGIAFIADTPYIANFNNAKILKWDGVNLTLVAQLPYNDPQTDFIGFLSAIDGQLIATHYGENSIYRIDPITGEFSVLAGSNQGNDDGPIGQATFNGPNGIVADQMNNKIYISEANTKNLRIIDAVTLGLENDTVANFDLKLIPNPAGNHIEIKGDLRVLSNYKIEVLDTLGKLIFQLNRTDASFILSETLDISKWAKGTYLVKVSNVDTSITKKFVKN
jgi:DNA-binding beta-propeller fold protein YncE